jgi:hypothetical protein
MDRYPVGPKTIEQAGKTEAGKLARCLNRVLYHSDNAEIAMKSFTNANGVGHFTTVTRKYICDENTFRNTDPLPKGLAACGCGDSYFETGKLLLLIRDYLEAAAIREVCE